jgi:hypothetical protein
MKGIVTVFCVHGNELSGFIKREGFREQLRDYYILKEE